MLDAILQRGDHFGRALEVHVGNPEWIEVRAAVPLEGTGGAAVGNGSQHDLVMPSRDDSRKENFLAYRCRWRNFSIVGLPLELYLAQSNPT